MNQRTTAFLAIMALWNAFMAGVFFFMFMDPEAKGSSIPIGIILIRVLFAYTYLATLKNLVLQAYQGFPRHFGLLVLYFLYACLFLGVFIYQVLTIPGPIKMNPEEFFVCFFVMADFLGSVATLIAIRRHIIDTIPNDDALVEVLVKYMNKNQV